MTAPMRSRNIPPSASLMLEALRGLGYSVAGALADIVDNSISAGATEVSVRFIWAGEQSRIAILDNGSGMDEEMLARAMRLGDRSPLAMRTSTDLGRFGLGLKTASFSQCRRLTVASKYDQKTSAFQWDLDYLAAGDGGWYLLEGAGHAHDLSMEHLSRVNSGTIVIWDLLDRITTPGCTVQVFLDMIDGVEAHFSMVFQRFIEGKNPRLVLKINDHAIQPWDPFLSDHPATWSSPVEEIKVGPSTAEVQAFVLPHKDRLTSDEQNRYAGPDGWTAQQGFYVYRNERLLVAGSWLGLGQGKPWGKDESFRLARIRLDIANSSDADWKIDIRKAIARPPIQIRKRLTSLADDVRSRARRVFAHRGQIIRPTGAVEAYPMWRSEQSKSGMRYRIQREHPVIKGLIEDAGQAAQQILALLRLIEETVPVQKIWLDTAESKETPVTRFAGEPPDEVLSVLRIFYRNLTQQKGLSPSEACHRLLHTDPFQDYPDLVESLVGKNWGVNI